MKRRVIGKMVRGQPYSYIPLGKFVVSAPGVCRGRPTFKNTRIEVAGVLERLASGHSVEELVAGYQGRVPREAIEEAAALAARALARQVPSRAGRP